MGKRCEPKLRDELANYKIPKKIIVAADLPLLPIGKIDKVALRTIATRHHWTSDIRPPPSERSLPRSRSFSD